MKRKSFITSVFVFILTFLVSYLGILEAPDRFLTDSLYQRPTAKDHRIKIIGIDEKTLAQWGTFSSWSREKSAELVRLLNADKEQAPSVIGFDIMFISEADRDEDAALAEACKDSVPVVMAANMVNKTVLEEDENGRLRENKLFIELMEQPYAALAENTIVGYANSASDQDGFVRHSVPFVTYGGKRIPSFSMAVYETFVREAGQEPNDPKTDKQNRFSFAYTGKPGNYEYFSLIDVLTGEIPAAYFKDSIVMVGAYAPGMLDSFYTPIDRSKAMYGVEVHANIIEALLEGKIIHRVNRVFYSALLALMAAGFYLLLLWLPLLAGGVGVAAVIGLQIAAGIAAFGKGSYLGVIVLPAAAVITYAVHIVRHYFRERRRRLEVTNVFKKYVAPQVVEEISKQDGFELKLGGESRSIAVLFVDIRGFTPLSESLSPEEVVEILNDYLNLTTNAIFKNGGMLDKFIGDATMAVFNAPFDLEDFEYRAICTALDIVAGEEALQKKIMEKHGKKVSFGIGINCGRAVVGNIGCEFRMDYTAIGDTVNTAARLESNAKPGQILISEAVYEKVKNRVKAETIGEIPLKGKSNQIKVYSVIKN